MEKKIGEKRNSLIHVSKTLLKKIKNTKSHAKLKSNRNVHCGCKAP